MTVPADPDRPQPVDPVLSPDAYRREILSWLGDDDAAAVQAATVARMRELVRAAGDRLRDRPEPSEWSVLECFGHLLDSEYVVSARVRWILAEDEPDIVGYDQALWVDALRHREADPDELIALFDALRGAEPAAAGANAGRGPRADRAAPRARPGELRPHRADVGRPRPIPPGPGGTGPRGGARRLARATQTAGWPGSSATRTRRGHCRDRAARRLSGSLARSRRSVGRGDGDGATGSTTQKAAAGRPTRGSARASADPAEAWSSSSRRSSTSRSGPSARSATDGRQPHGRHAFAVQRRHVAATRVVQVRSPAGHPGPEVGADRPSTTTVPPVMYSQPCGPMPSTTASAPLLRTAKRIPARPTRCSRPPVAP